MGKDRSLVEVLLDFLQPYTKSPYGVGVGGIRVSDVEARNRCKSFTTAITTIIPGPNQPHTMYPYLLPLVEDLGKLSALGMSVPNSMAGSAMDASHPQSKFTSQFPPCGDRQPTANPVPSGVAVEGVGSRPDEGVGPFPQCSPPVEAVQGLVMRRPMTMQPGMQPAKVDERRLYFHCWGFLGDSPARWKCGNLCGISKMSACSYCKMGAVYHKGPAGHGGALRVMGYDRPQHQER